LDRADFVEITDPHRLTPLQVLSLSARSKARSLGRLTSSE